MPTLYLRVDLSAQHAIGPDTAALLDAIQTKGSIRSVAASLTMSYRKAWLLIQALETEFGDKIVLTATGGASGGGASLTPLGRKVLALYRRIERRSGRAVAHDMTSLSQLRRWA